VLYQIQPAPQQHSAGKSEEAPLVAAETMPKPL